MSTIKLANRISIEKFLESNTRFEESDKYIHMKDDIFEEFVLIDKESRIVSFSGFNGYIFAKIDEGVFVVE